MHALWNHWSHVWQHTPGVVQRTAFLHMLRGNLGDPGLVATSQALLTSTVYRYRYTSFDLCGSTIGLRERPRSCDLVHYLQQGTVLVG